MALEKKIYFEGPQALSLCPGGGGGRRRGRGRGSFWKNNETIYLRKHKRKPEMRRENLPSLLRLDFVAAEVHYWLHLSLALEQKKRSGGGYSAVSEDRRDQRE